MSDRPGHRRRRSRWFSLGSGELKRGSDRLHALSRLVLAGLLVLAVPLGVASGIVVHRLLDSAAESQRQARVAVPAVLLTDATGAWDAGATVGTPATWRTAAGPRKGTVDAPAGDRAGATVRIWLDGHGERTVAPLTEQDVRAEALATGIIATLAVAVLAGLGHLSAVALLDRRRMRRWTEQWNLVEPLWTSRFR
jgi:hypothetical protein